jgi:NAD(P)-dependent dehydrogenase (short-subunit alcohol dehydrogenase family)
VVLSSCHRDCSHAVAQRRKGGFFPSEENSSITTSVPAACNSCSNRPVLRSACKISGDRRCTVGKNLRSEREGHVIRHASHLCAQAQERARCHSQHGKHGCGGPGSSIHYAAVKGAVVSMTMSVAREYATQSIRARSISPGPVKTPFQAAVLARTDRALPRRHTDEALRRARRDRRARAVMYCDACPLMTADTVYVNGRGGWR